MEDTEDHKCFEACSAEGKFATKGIDQQGSCPSQYNTVDTTKTVLQCPDGVTNVRYCAGTALNVTIATKGEAQYSSVKPSFMVSEWPFKQCYHKTDANKCYQACSDDASFHGFETKGLTNEGECPKKFDSTDSKSVEDVCEDGVTSIKYCEADGKRIIKVEYSTKGESR